MENFLLLAVLAATFGFGFFVVKRLDCILDNREEPAQAPPWEERLYIGYSDPGITGCLTEILMRHTKQHPKADVSLFDGTQAELLQALSEGKLDLVALPEDAAIGQLPGIHMGKASLIRSPFAAAYGIPVKPVSQGVVPVTFVWVAEPTGAVRDVLLCLEKAL